MTQNDMLARATNIDASSTPPAISVFIPTYNRVATLMECLRRYEAQTWRDFEMIVVDDGSTDGTQQQVCDYVAAAPYPILYLRQAHSGPGPARNLGLRHARAPLLFFTGDDIWALPELLQWHIAGHARHPGEREAILGLSRFVNPRGHVTKFERWLENEGWQFEYGRMKDGDQTDWRHFYTSNLSLKTSLLRSYASPENFPPGAYADIELGYRIYCNGGLIIIYNAKARAEHFHPMGLAASCRRLYRVGQNARLMASMHPEIASAMLIHGTPRRLSLYRWLAGRHRLIRTARTLLESTTDISAMRYFWGKLMRLYYFAGQYSLPEP